MVFIKYLKNGIINLILLKLTRLENYLSKWLPNISGGSLLCVSIKKLKPPKGFIKPFKSGIVVLLLRVIE
jgi:hypothetical protein